MELKMQSKPASKYFLIRFFSDGVEMLVSQYWKETFVEKEGMAEEIV